MEYDKSVLQSKTFWLNVIGAVTILAAGLPENIAVPVMAVLNVINRFFSSGTVSFSFPGSSR